MKKCNLCHSSGLDSEDLELLKEFESNEISGGEFCITDNDLGFTQCDVSGLYNNCIEYKFYKNLNSEGK